MFKDTCRDFQDETFFPIDIYSVLLIHAGLARAEIHAGMTMLQLSALTRCALPEPIKSALQRQHALDLYSMLRHKFTSNSPLLLRQEG